MIYLIEFLPTCMSLVASAAAVHFAFHLNAKLNGEQRRLDERIAVLFDRMNEHEGSVKTIALTPEQRESLTIRSPLPTAKVVRR